MTRALTRLALAATLPVAALTAMPAQATTVPGCYGAVVLICDVTVTVTLPGLVETYSDEVPVCAGACYDIPVTLVRSAPGAPGSICVSYENRDGEVVFNNCRAIVVPTIPDIPEIPDVNVNDLMDEVVEIVWDRVLCQVPAFENNVQCW